MIRILLLLLALVPGALKAQQFCEDDFEGRRSNPLLQELFSSGLDEEGLIRGYVGITHTQMQALAAGSPINYNQWEHRALFVVPAKDEHEDVVQQAAKFATRESLIHLMRKRISLVPDSSARALAFIPSIVDTLLDRAYAEAKGPRLYSPSYAELFWAVKNLEIGQNLPAERKMRRLMNWVGGRAEEGTKVGPRLRAKFVALFANLPIPSGYVLGLNRRGVHNIPGSIDLKDLAGIEPLSQSDYNYLAAGSYE